MLLASFTILLSLIFLVWSADRFVDNSVDIATHLGVSPIMIGLTIVALGTSAPEILVSINSALANAPNIALGNAVGSNLANTGLVLGLTLLLIPITGLWLTIRLEIIALLVITLLGGVLLIDLHLSRYDGIILISSLFLFLTVVIISKTRTTLHTDTPSDDTLSTHPDISIPRLTFNFLLMLAVLIGSSNALVWAAKNIALYLGISELIIGLTVVAIGTSLPELAASIASVYKKQNDMALGNILGSNIFNIGGVLGIAGIISPFSIVPEGLYRDYSSVIAITVLLIFFLLLSLTTATKHQKTYAIGRFAGSTLLAFYVFYNLYIVYSIFTNQ
jgi:cation:H+ antiporter